MFKKSFYSKLIFSAVIVFFYMPLLVLVLFSFNQSKTMLWTGFSFNWYRELFLNSPQIWNAFGNSFLIAISSALTATLVGTMGAIGVYWYNIKIRKAIQLMTFIPLFVPEIILGVSLLIFFVGIGLKLGLFTIFLAHVTFNIPFVFLIIMSRLDEFDKSIIEAAFDLGASELDALFKVIIPIVFPGILVGFLMSITLSLEDFVITFFVAGPGSTTLPLYIYSMIRFGVSPIVNSASVFLLITTILFAVLSLKFFKYIFRN